MLTNPNYRRLIRRLLALCVLAAALAFANPAPKTQAQRSPCGQDTNCRICPEFWECDYATCDCVCVSQFCCQYYYPWDPYCGQIEP